MVSVGESMNAFFGTGEHSKKQRQRVSAAKQETNINDLVLQKTTFEMHTNITILSARPQHAEEIYDELLMRWLRTNQVQMDAK